MSAHLPGQVQRPLLRPVIWLGNWQFACLGYYEPPRRVHDAAVEAEPFPPVLAKIAADAEGLQLRYLASPRGSAKLGAPGEGPAALRDPEVRIAHQLFSGPVWKDALLHRVQRVEDKRGELLGPSVEGFRTRG